MIEHSIMLKIMLGTALLGATAGVVGAFAVLRGRALVGDMLAHASLPGICIAFLILGHRNIIGLSLGALASGILAVGLMTLVVRWTRTKEDAAIGIMLSTFFGLGVVLLSVAQRSTSGNHAGLATYLFGETAGMQLRDILLLAGVAAVILLLVVFLFKEFQLLSFDSNFGAAQGWPMVALDVLLMGAVAVVTVVGLPIVGVILMAAMIILPGASARFWTSRLSRLLLVAGFFGAAAGTLGTLLASPLPREWLGFDPLGFGDTTKSLPPGPLIVLSATAMFLISMVFAPRRGILAISVSEFRLRARIAREHLLRSLYELSEPQFPERRIIPESELLAYRHWSRWLLNWWLGWAERRDLILRSSQGIQLTPEGLMAAAEVTRTHRLWELYLVEYANIAADHVDRDADDVEHLLPAPVIATIEREMAATMAIPGFDVTVPESPHELPTE